MRGLSYSLSESKTVGGALVVTAVWIGINWVAMNSEGVTPLSSDWLLVAIGAVGLKESAAKFKSE